MLEALLEPVEACAHSTASLPSAPPERMASMPDPRVLDVLQRIPEMDCLFTGGVVASWHASFGSLHSRRWHRVAYDKPLLITPLDDLGDGAAGRTLVAQGRDLSLSGFSFCHTQPLASRKVIVQFRDEATSTVEGLLALLRWCRFRRDGVYQSGGQFVRAIALDGIFSPAESECDGVPAATVESEAVEESAVESAAIELTQAF
jgi:hypothetical protein